MSELNVVDSSGWLEYLADSPRGSLFAEAIENTAALIVPVITIYEVLRVTLREKSEVEAVRIIAGMRLGRVIDIDSSLVLEAVTHSLPLGDSLIYATARRHNATLWTQDAHFAGLPSVQYFERN